MLFLQANSPKHNVFHVAQVYFMLTKDILVEQMVETVSSSGKEHGRSQRLPLD